MNTQRAKILLEKVNALFKSMSVDETNVTPIEKDLMLSYLRQLYDSILENNQAATPSPAVAAPSQNTYVPPKVVTNKSVYKPPRIIEIPDSLKEDIDQPQPTFKSKKKNKSKSKSSHKPPRIITPPKLNQTPTPVTKPVVVPKPQPKPTPPPPKPEPTPIANDKHDQLFEFKAAKELSEKLSQRPIRDLTKAFSLNDKLLYANELFGKELFVFNEEVKKINTLKNFDEAKNYLAQLADKFNWSSKNKTPMAKEFVLLVKRRFS